MIPKLMYEGKMLCFMDFIELYEGVSPRETAYKFSREDSGFTGIFESSNETVVVVLDKTQRPGWYSLGFARHKAGRPKQPVSHENYTMSDQVPTDAFYDLFGKVLYVALDMSKVIGDVNRIRFQGGYPSIARFYKVLLQNKNFVAKLNSFGYELDVEMMSRYGSDIFIIRRIA